MQTLDVYKQVPSRYTLVNYNVHHQLYYQQIDLTEYEAHSLNQSFALNGVSKRYIKNTSRFNKQTIQ